MFLITANDSTNGGNYVCTYVHHIKSYLPPPFISFLPSSSKKKGLGLYTIYPLDPFPCYLQNQKQPRYPDATAAFYYLLLLLVPLFFQSSNCNLLLSIILLLLVPLLSSSQGSKRWWLLPIVALAVFSTVVPNVRVYMIRSGIRRMGRQVQTIERFSSIATQVVASVVVPGCWTNLVSQGWEGRGKGKGRNYGREGGIYS